jgi:peptidyl-prolyl cis-trans isomerase A (cyclophilin A)
MKVLMLILSVLFFISCSSTKTGDLETEETGDLETEESGDLETDESGDLETEESGDFDADEQHLVITDTILLETNKGEIKLGLYGNEAPDTTDNFIQYVKDEFYDGLIFHRIVPGFVIQGGGFNQELEPAETRGTIPFEGHPEVKHVKYALSMARGNSVNSATSQFFITLDVFPHLDFSSEDDFFDENKFPCTAFGIVLEGFDVVDAIAAVEIDESSVPTEPVVIISSEVINEL